MEYPFAGERIFDKPLVSFVRGDDPIFQEYKKIIGPHHLTPEEWMAWQAAKNGVPAPKAADLSVVSFIMPITERTRQENAAMTEWPSERWAHTRLLGEIFSQAMVREIVTYLMGRGVLAVAPDVTPLMRKQRYPGVGWASPWSHRHVAYAAGLGTFGMHDFFITEKGAAHRCGSFIVNLRLKPDRTRPENIHANCLQHNGVKCPSCSLIMFFVAGALHAVVLQAIGMYILRPRAVRFQPEVNDEAAAAVRGALFGDEEIMHPECAPAPRHRPYAGETTAKPSLPRGNAASSSAALRPELPPALPCPSGRSRISRTMAWLNISPNRRCCAHRSDGHSVMAAFS